MTVLHGSIIVILAIGLFLAFAGRVLGGRFAALAIAAVLGIAMAYFFMPPFFSLQVSGTYDRLALVFYGMVGLVLAGPFRAKKSGALSDAAGFVAYHSATETVLSNGIDHILAGGLGDRLRATGFILHDGDMLLPIAHVNAVQVISSVLDMVLQVPQLQKITICGVRLPGACRIVIAAHRVWPPPLNEVIVVWRDNNCIGERVSEWPSLVDVKWFDNGYDRLFQVSFERCTGSVPDCGGSAETDRAGQCNGKRD